MASEADETTLDPVRPDLATQADLDPEATLEAPTDPEATLPPETPRPGDGPTHGEGSDPLRIPLESTTKLVPGLGSSPDGTVLGPYLIESELGRGGMGVVYKARHQEKGETVALKVLLAGTGATRRQRKRFMREAAAASRLDDPGIVKVIDQGELGELLYMALEFIDGATLDEVIDELKLDQIVALIGRVCRGLDVAHQQGVLHRDIKPANIIIRDDDEVPVITDFGLARNIDQTSSLTESGCMVGTPLYMAPEQIRGDDVGASVDVFALGVILYQGLTGRHPFHEAETPLELFHAITKREPPGPGSYNHRIPPELDRICLKSLARDPKDRFKDAGEMADALEAWHAGRPRSLDDDDRPPPTPLPSWPLMVLGGSALVLAVILAVVFGGREGSQPAADDSSPEETTEKTPEAGPEKTPQPNKTLALGPFQHSKPMMGHIVLPGTKGLLTLCKDGRLRAWDLEGRLRWAVALEHPISTLASNHDGTRIALGLGDGSFWLLDPSRGPSKTKLKGTFGEATALAFSRDGQVLAGLTAGDTSILAWDGATGKPLDRPWLRARNIKKVADLVFSPDKDVLWEVGQNVWKHDFVRKSKPPIHPLMYHDNVIFMFRFSPNGERAMACSANEFGREASLEVFDLESKQTVWDKTFDPKAVSCGSVTLDWTRVALGFDDGEVQVFDLRANPEKAPEPIERFKLESHIVSLDYLNDGRLTVGLGDRVVIRPTK